VKKDHNERWEKLKDIWHIIERLRGESGCPWDRKQTPETIQTYLVEEAHEGAAAVRAGKSRGVAEELGDILFMVFFLAYLYEERGDFSLDEVCDLISEKMIRRHPHVFGETSVESAEEVKDNWEKIKAEEKSKSGLAPEPVPETLPALIRAYRIVSRLAGKENGAWNDIGERTLDFSLKARKMVESLGSGQPLSAESIGDLFLDLVNLARIAGFRPEDCLHQRLRKIGHV
jgi:MazG family protein